MHAACTPTWQQRIQALQSGVGRQRQPRAHHHVHRLLEQAARGGGKGGAAQHVGAGGVAGASLAEGQGSNWGGTCSVGES